MKKIWNSFLTLAISMILVFEGVPINVKADTVGRVQTVKIKTSYKNYKSFYSTDPVKWDEVQYEYGEKVFWEPVEGADGYEVQTYGVATKKWTKKVETSKTYYTFTNLLEKDKFKIRVRAYQRHGGKRVYGDWSEKKTIHVKGIRTKIGTNDTFKKKFMDRYAAEQAFVLQNKYRRKKGVSNLKWSEDLYKICRTRAKQISRNFSHDSFITESKKYYKKKYGIQGGYIAVNRGNGKIVYYMLAGGENIAWGQSSYDYVCKEWKNSKGHYQNMVRKKFRTGAIACYRMKDVTYWVATFGEIGVKNKRKKKGK